MERITLHAANTQECAARAAAIARAGGVVLFPTDTLYGLGADAFSDEAVAKVVAVKGRDEKKPIHVLVSNIAMAARYGEISDVVRSLASRLPKGKITFVVKKSSQGGSASGGKEQHLNTGIVRGIETFGFRIPDHEFCIGFVEAVGIPITATSANRAGELPERSVDAILTQLGTTAGMIDLVVEVGEMSPSAPSSIVDLSGSTPRVLREGVVSRRDIEAILGG